MNKVYAINPDGSLRWSFQTGADIFSSPAIGPDGTIYVGSWDKNLYAIKGDGTQKWVFPTGDKIWASPAIGSDGTIYIGSTDGYLYAINPDGSLRWSFQTSITTSSAVIGADGTICVGEGPFNAISPDGQLKWSLPVWSSASPAIGSNGDIFVTDTNLYNLVAISANGVIKWTFPIPGSRSSPAIGSDGTIYVGSSDGNLYAINCDSGGLADSPWPMFHHDVKHSGRASETTPPDTSITGGPSGTITYNDVTFTYTGSDNATSTSNLAYSYMLDGYNSSWSSYSTSTSKSYYDLPNASYTFYVKAKDVGENVDLSPAVRSFTVNYTASCPNCSGSEVVLKNVTFPSGCDCECVGTKSITIGLGVTIKNGARVTIKAPKVKVQSGFHAESGAVVRIKQE